MVRRAIAALAVLAVTGGAALAQAKPPRVLDAVYRGTLVCAKLPFMESPMREAIAVTIDGGKVAYTHAVRLSSAPEAAEEKGTGKLDGAKLSLNGSWKGSAGEYQANYEGSFVRRSAKLIGTQTWTYQGRILTRSCNGVVKRALRGFLPRGKKPAA